MEWKFIPTEWELDLNGNGDTTTWESEQLMVVGSQNHSRGLVNSHYTTVCALCLQLSHKGPQCDYLSSVTQWCIVLKLYRELKRIVCSNCST